jgi:hypothetical protein
MNDVARRRDFEIRSEPGDDSVLLVTKTLRA